MQRFENKILRNRRIHRNLQILFAKLLQNLPVAMKKQNNVNIKAIQLPDNTIL